MHEITFTGTPSYHHIRAVHISPLNVDNFVDLVNLDSSFVTVGRGRALQSAAGHKRALIIALPLSGDHSRSC